MSLQNLLSLNNTCISRLGMSVITQGGSGRLYVGSGRQYVTGS